VEYDCRYVTRQRPVNNRGMVFSAQSVSEYYKKEQLAVAVRDLVR
jgi:hypothetical protein